MGKKPHKTRRIHADCSCTKVRMKSYVPLRLGFVLSKLWKPNKTRSCEKEAIQNQERIKLRMKSDVPLRFGFVLSELWKPNKTRSCTVKNEVTVCGKEAIQNQERIKLRMKSDVPLRFRFALSELWNAKQNQELWERPTNQERIHAKSDVPLCFGFILSELWKPNKTRSCGKKAKGNPCKLLLHKNKNEIRCSAPLRIYLANCKLSNINLAKLHKLSNTPTIQKQLKHTLRCSWFCGVSHQIEL